MIIGATVRARIAASEIFQQAVTQLSIHLVKIVLIKEMCQKGRRTEIKLSTKEALIVQHVFDDCIIKIPLATLCKQHVGRCRVI